MILMEVMMKNNVYVRQFFCDSFGNYLFLKPYNYLKKNIKDRNVFKIMSILLAIFYVVLMFFAIILIFNLTYPF